MKNLFLPLTFYPFGSFKTSLNCLILFFVLSFCAFVFTILIILHPISGVVLHDNLALLWRVTSSINHAASLLLWLLQNVSIFYCGFQNDSSQRCWPRQFFFILFEPLWMVWVLSAIVYLSLGILSGTFIEKFYSFHPLEKLCEFCIKNFD